MSTWSPATLREVKDAIVKIEHHDRVGAHEEAHSEEDRLVRSVLAAVEARVTNHRVMVRRLVEHLKRADERQAQRWMA